MPPRFSYWTIIAGGLPTAFRAAERDELIPTFTRIREKHPDAQMKWFARGKLWDSPDAARRDLGERRDRTDPRGARQDGGGGRARGGPARHGDRDGQRTRDWRPGGEHRDPRQKYKDAKKAKNLAHRREKFARKHGPTRPAAFRPQQDPGPRHETRPARPKGFHPAGASRPRPDRPGGARGERPWRDRPPRGDRPAGVRPETDRRRDEPGARRERNGQAGGRSSEPTAAGRHGSNERSRPWGRGPERRTKRPFQSRRFERNQGTEEPPTPPRPRGPNREPRPSESPAPTPPPRPSEPSEPPGAPPERGRLNRHRRRKEP